MGFFNRLLRRRGRQAPQGSESTTAPLPTVPHGAIWDGPRFAVLDVETTGLSATEHRIVEIAVVTTDPRGVVLEEWSTRINPQGPVGATHIHGITQADVAGAPPFEEIIPELNRRLARAAVAAHNARFDLAFLRSEYRRAGWDLPFVPALCTLEASDHHLPTLDRRRLADCCWAVGASLEGAHSALGDARATATLLSVFMDPSIGYPPPPEHVALAEQALPIAWPTHATLPPSERLGPAPVRGKRLSPRAYRVMARQSSAPPAAGLMDLIEKFSLVDALDEGAPPGSLSYLEKLAEVLEDGEITDDEAADLTAVSTAMALTEAHVAAANRAFVLALAHEALADGKVTRAERAELTAVAALLKVNPKVIPGLLDRAEQARNVRLSEGLKPLPDNWEHGEPLRVGDKVVFTGCDDDVRDRLETESERVGVRVLGTVSAKVAVLVSDGSMDGGKAAKARELRTRTVHPLIYRELLAYLQPSLPRTAARPDGASRVALAEPPAARGPGVAGPSTQVGTAEGGDSAAPNPAAVRSWARANGLEVGVRGRLPKEIVHAFVNAHADA